MKSSVKNDDLIRHQESFFPRDVPGSTGTLHPRLHDILSTQDHYVAGSQWDLVGLTAVDTLGLLTPSSNTSGGTEAILKSDSNGRLLLDSLGIGTAASVSDRIEISNGGSIGQTAGPLLTFDDTNNYLGITGGYVAVGTPIIIPPTHGLSVYTNASQLALYYDSDQTKYAQFTVGSTGTIELDAVTNIVLDPGGQNVNPGSSYTDDLGAYNIKWRTLYAAELYVETLVAQDVLATIGGRIMVAPTSKLTSDATAGAGVIYTEHNLFAVNDYLYLATAPGGIAQFEVMQVTGGPGGGPPYAYNVTRNKDGSGANAWVSGDAVVNLGYAAGEGYIELTSTQTIHSQLGPTITIYTRTGGTNWNDVNPTVTMGNLDSFLGYGTEYGFAVGNDLELASPSSASFMGATLDRTNGLRLFNTDIQLYDSTTPKVDIKHDEGIYVFNATPRNRDSTVFAAVFAGSSLAYGLDANDVWIGQPYHSTAASQKGLWWDNSASTLYVKAGSTNYAQFSGADLSFYSNSVRTLYFQGSTGDAIFGELGANKFNLFWDASEGDLQLRSNTTPIFNFNGSTGDATFGIVATNKGNMQWDSSDSILRFRGGLNGTVTQAYISTAGAIMAGSATVWLDDAGVSIQATQVEDVAENQLKFISSTSTVLGWMDVYESPLINNYVRIGGEDYGGLPTHIYIQSGNTGYIIANTVRLHDYGDLYVEGLTITYDDIRTAGGISVGSVSDNTIVGEIRADQFTGEVIASLADDDFTSFIPAIGVGVVLIAWRSGGGSTTCSGLVTFRLSAPAAAGVVAGQSKLAATTGVLDGTTGADTFFTVSAHTDGKVYLENRLGSSVSFSYTVFGR